MTRRLLLPVLLAAPLVAGLAPSASAYCDPRYEPLCLNDCVLALPPADEGVRGVAEWATRYCPR